jgi:multiple sugar transport system substrate-binding protein
MFEGALDENSILPSLAGSTWGHPRGFGPLIALSEENPDLFSARVKWDIRTLQQFADHSFEDLSSKYDLIVFDHPFIGEAAQSNYLLPLNHLLDADYIYDQKINSVGKSFESYSWNNNLYALPIDVAGHVSARRADLFTSLKIDEPKTWTEVLALANRMASTKGPRVAVPGIGVDIWCLFMTLCANQGVMPYETKKYTVPVDVGMQVLKTISQLIELSPEDARHWNPIDLLDTMSEGDDVLYCPALFGYSNYSIDGFRNALVSFGSLPSAGFGPSGGILGGAGIGVSTNSRFPIEAAQIAGVLASPEIQRTLYATNGGQPGHRSAWISPEINTLAHGFYANTLDTLDRSFLRRRFPGFIHVQSDSGKVLAKTIYGQISFTSALKEIDEIYLTHLKLWEQ